jgi:hypothetical protein
MLKLFEKVIRKQGNEKRRASGGYTQQFAVDGEVYDIIPRNDQDELYQLPLWRLMHETQDRDFDNNDDLPLIEPSDKETTQGTKVRVTHDASSFFRAVYQSSLVQECPNFEDFSDRFDVDQSSESKFVSSVKRAYGKRGSLLNDIYTETIRANLVKFGNNLESFLTEFGHSQEHYTSFGLIFKGSEKTWYFNDEAVAEKLGDLIVESDALRFKEYIGSEKALDRAVRMMTQNIVRPTMRVTQIERTVLTSALEELGVNLIITPDNTMSIEENDLTVFYNGNEFYEGLRS